MNKISHDCTLDIIMDPTTSIIIISLSITIWMQIVVSMVSKSLLSRVSIYDDYE